eukprot:9345642-Alexandrium_andersonii.AAC.1
MHSTLWQTSALTAPALARAPQLCATRILTGHWARGHLARRTTSTCHESPVLACVLTPARTYW